jgi:hypothetical protein
MNAQISCTGSLSVRVAGADLPMQCDYIKTDLYCSGIGDGTIEILAIGGTPPYHYTWEDGNTDREREGLSAGSYSVTINDSNNCVDTMKIQLNQMIPGPGNDELYLADEYGCGSCYLQDGQRSFIYQDVDYMVHVTDIFDGIPLEEVEVCVDIYPSSKKFLSRMLMKRYWQMRTTKNTARTRLYFRTSEFEQLASESGYRSMAEIIDTADISLVVFKGGNSTYENYDFMTTIPRSNFNVSKSNISDDQWVVTFTYSDFEPNAMTGFYLDIADKTIATSTEEIIPIDTSDFYLLQNPVLDKAILTNDGFDKYVDGVVKIVDIHGRVLHREDFQNNNLKSYPIDVDNYPAGAYFYVIEVPRLKMKRSLKFIKI